MYDLPCNVKERRDMTGTEQKNETKRIANDVKVKRRSKKSDLAIHTSHLISEQDIKLAGTLCVGGNLTVHGNLMADRVYCFGAMTVHGNIQARIVVCAVVIECGGEIRAASIRVGCEEDDDSDDECNWLVFAQDFIADAVDAPIKQLIDKKTLTELRRPVQDHWSFNYEHAIRCKGDLVCEYIFVARGLDVGACFNPDDADIYGTVSAGRMVCEGDLYVRDCLIVSDDAIITGELEVGLFISCPGTLRADGDLLAFNICAGNLVVEGKLTVVECIESTGKILSVGQMSAGMYIKAGDMIASKVSVSAGSDYGIFAGLRHPRSAWSERGYVCAPKKPANIISGIFHPLKAKRPWKFSANEYLPTVVGLSGTY